MSAGDRESDLTVTPPKTWATGVPAVASALAYSLRENSPRRTAQTLLKLNQKDGIDCPGCAWPDPSRRAVNEYCENGARHVNDEATTRRVTADFFAQHSIADLAQRSDQWLNDQGRLTEPMVRRPGATHYEPISWDGALDLLATELRELPSPDEAIFYTSGRLNNEAAFLLQLFVRAFGTNNLPDCSNMCHESSSFALGQTLGLGKGNVSLTDLHEADLIIVCGQNPGSNHPRMLSALEQTKRNGGRIIAVNPLREAGLMRFKNPQRPRGIVGRGTDIADQYAQIRSGGDLALFQMLSRLLLEAEDAAPGTVLDWDFIEDHTSDFEAFADHVRSVRWEDVLAATGLAREEIERIHEAVLASEKVIVCWAMGLTQHRHGVPMIREIVNFLLLRGNLGRQGAGVCPVRGHSNVQGDRTMGIWERVPDAFLDKLAAEFDFAPPRDPGVDSVGAVRALRDGRAQVFVGVAGNFVRAMSDSTVTEEALRRCRLTVQVSTKLNRSHVVCGESALILPTLGRSDRDVQASGHQFVTTEDSMSQIRASRGPLEPAAPTLLSEVAIICRLAERTLTGAGASIPWRDFEGDYGLIRDRIARVVPGFERFNERIQDGFRLPHPVNERRYPTATGRAMFTVNDLVDLTPPPGHLVLQTIRSHDQWNTIPYTPDDRYRGIHGDRRVVLVNAEDLADVGVVDGAVVDLVSVWDGGEERRASGFRVVSYPTARGCAAAYYPETNVLVPLESLAESSNTPTYKGIVVRLEPSTGPAAAGG